VTSRPECTPEGRAGPVKKATYFANRRVDLAVVWFGALFIFAGVAAIRLHAGGTIRTERNEWIEQHEKETVVGLLGIDPT
jgi:hypothetical protein